MVQQELDGFQVGMVPKVGIQRSAVQPAEGDGVAVDLRAEGAEAHKVDRGFEDRHLLNLRVAGQPKAHLFVAAQDVPFKSGPIEVQGPALAGEFGLAAAVPADKHARTLNT